MQIKTDLHVHTIASTHAYSTVLEYITMAQQNGLELIAITDHTMLSEDSPHVWHFTNIGVIPRKVGSVEILRGAETNICNANGDIDIADDERINLDIIIASLHLEIFSPKSADEHEQMLVGTMQNPNVHILGHVGRCGFTINAENIARAAKKYNKLIEVNNHTLKGEVTNKDNCKELLRQCKIHEVPIVVNSDAHICFEMGVFDKAEALLKSVDFPYELIVNRDKETLKRHLSLNI